MMLRRGNLGWYKPVSAISPGYDCSRMSNGLNAGIVFGAVVDPSRTSGDVRSLTAFAGTAARASAGQGKVTPR